MPTCKVVVYLSATNITYNHKKKTVSKRQYQRRVHGGYFTEHLHLSGPFVRSPP
eukprot:NODE_5163_length_405_cov_38426.544944_g4133_i0.p2 GENE.NODE_5163_length_405_cov_38426.544944_g4133_i0~~NODE_5163_length_405_cov_38426.544944_g4133_i0.p2  ORF type:complete len:54 (+),score=48.76 NODE_5163_length_405_cov_38426.544944_g4133_i0:52-213(+)